MWTEFYNYRGKDSASLQHSTKISFNFFAEITIKFSGELKPMIVQNAKDDNLVIFLYKRFAFSFQ